jgi:hypothetical protein
MALWLQDSFDGYSVASDLIGNGSVWASTITALPSLSATGGRWGGQCISMSGAQGLISPQFTTNMAFNSVASAFAIAGWFNFGSTKPSGAMTLGGFGLQVSLSNWCGFGLNTSGQLTQTSNAGSSGPYSTQNLCDGNWHWIEAYDVNTGAGSTIKASVDGIVVQTTNSASNNFNPPAPFYMFLQNTATGPTAIKVDDVFFWTADAALVTGDIVLASFPIGPKRIRTASPTGAGSNTNMTPLSGANYANVNQFPVNDGDTSYVSTSLTGIRDTYSFGGAVVPANEIPSWATVKVVAKNADAGAINYRGLAYNGGNFGLGATAITPNSYAQASFPIFRDPATSSAWDNAGINAAEFGVGT